MGFPKTKKIGLSDIKTVRRTGDDKKDFSYSQSGKIIRINANHFGEHPKFQTFQFTWSPLAPKWVNKYQTLGYRFTGPVLHRINFSKGRGGISIFIRAQTTDLASASRVYLKIKCTTRECERWFFRRVASLKVSQVLCSDCGKLVRGKKRQRSVEKVEKQYGIRILSYAVMNGMSEFITVESIKRVEKILNRPILSVWPQLSLSTKRALMGDYIVRQGIGSMIQRGISSSPAARRAKWQIFYDKICGELDGREERFVSKDGNRRSVDCETSRYVLELKNDIGRILRGATRDLLAIADYRVYARSRGKAFFVLVNQPSRLIQQSSLPKYYLGREHWGKVGVSQRTAKTCEELQAHPERFNLDKPRTRECQRIVDTLHSECKRRETFPSADELRAICFMKMGKRYSYGKICMAIDPACRILSIVQIRERLKLKGIPFRKSGDGLPHKGKFFFFNKRWYTAQELIQLLTGEKGSDWLRTLLSNSKRSGVGQIRLSQKSVFEFTTHKNPFPRKYWGENVARASHYQSGVQQFVEFRGKVFSFKSFVKTVSKSGDASCVNTLLARSKNVYVKTLIPKDGEILRQGKPNSFRHEVRGKKITRIGHGKWKLGNQLIDSKKLLVRLTGVKYESLAQRFKISPGRGFVIPTNETFSRLAPNPFRAPFRGKSFRLMKASETPAFFLGRIPIKDKKALQNELRISNTQYYYWFARSNSKKTSFKIPSTEQSGSHKFLNPIKKRYRGMVVKLAENTLARK